MYNLRPIVNSGAPVILPDCMYKVKSAVSAETMDQGRSPACPSMSDLEALEKRQKSLLERLLALTNQVTNLEKEYNVSASSSHQRGQSSTSNGIKDIVVTAHPASPPVALLLLREMLSEQKKVFSAYHTHSSATKLTNKHKNLSAPNGPLERATSDLIFTLIWKNVTSASLMVNPAEQFRIDGEMNIARYLARLFKDPYDGPNSDIAMATEIDQWVDLAGEFQTASSRERTALFKTFNSHLGKNPWLVGSGVTLADIALWGVLVQSDQIEKAPANVKKWFQQCNSVEMFKNVCNMLGITNNS